MSKQKNIIIGILSLFSLVSCQALLENKIQKEMLEKQYYSAKEKVSSYEIARLTMNSDYTYSFYYKHNDYIKDIKNEKWTHELTFKYEYHYNAGNVAIPIDAKESAVLAVFRLENCFDDEGKQQYFVYGGATYVIHSTNEEVTQNYLESFRTEGYGGTKDNKLGFILIYGIELLPKGYAEAEWK